MVRAEGSYPRKQIPVIAAFLALVGVAVSGCTLGSGGTNGTVRVGTTTGGGQMVERDVEAPEVFQMEEAGLWDGRPSLGGVWVAHPEAVDPERVVILNAESGASVTGALFRRERDNPGPRFQLSSEAANALGILPGAPTPIRVTALRLEQVEVAPVEGPAEDEAEIAEVAAPEDAQPEAPRGLRALFQRRPPPAPSDDAAEDGTNDEPPSRAATDRNVILH